MTDTYCKHRFDVPVIKYVGGEDGWLQTGSIHAADATAEQIKAHLSDLGAPNDPFEHLDYLAATLGCNRAQAARERMACRAMEDKRRRYMWLHLKRKGN